MWCGVVLDQEALTEALLELPAVAAAHADRYARFVERNCGLEDGRASERVLAAVFPAEAGDGARPGERARRRPERESRR